MTAPARDGRRKPTARKRAPGRPRGASPDLRPRLLDAAIACFVCTGIAATSLRAIATEAGVTPALLHYYFGSKEQLVDALVEERILPVVGEMREVMMRSGDDVATLVAGFVGKMSELIARHPWWPPLWVREVLCEGGMLRELLVTRIATTLPQQMTQRFAAAQARGELNPDLDPRLLFVSLIGLTLFPAAGAPIWRRIFDADALKGDALDGDAQRRHTIALLDRGLGLPPPKHMENT